MKVEVRQVLSCGKEGRSQKESKVKNVMNCKGRRRGDYAGCNEQQQAYLKPRWGVDVHASNPISLATAAPLS